MEMELLVALGVSPKQKLLVIVSKSVAKCLRKTTLESIYLDSPLEEGLVCGVREVTATACMRWLLHVSISR